MARGSHHRSGGHSGSHHRSGGSRSHSSSSFRSSGSRSYTHYGSYTHKTFGGSSSTYNREAPEGVVSYNGNWMNGRLFCLNPDDPVVKSRDKDKILEKNNSSSFVLMYIFCVFCMGLFGSNLFYELFIPIFENMSMADFTFMFFDNLLYYFPIIVMFTLIGIKVIRSNMVTEKKRALCMEVVITSSRNWSERLHWKHSKKSMKQSCIRNVRIVAPRCLMEV